MGFLKKKSRIAKMHPGDVLGCFVERSDLVETQIGDLILDSQGGGLLSSGDSITYMCALPSDLGDGMCNDCFSCIWFMFEEETNSFALRWYVPSSSTGLTTGTRFSLHADRVRSYLSNGEWNLFS